MREKMTRGYTVPSAGGGPTPPATTTNGGPSSEMATTDRLIPGTSIPYTRQRGIMDFFVHDSDMHADTAAVLEGHGYRFERRQGRGIWFTASLLRGSEPAFEVIVEPDGRHRRTYASQAIAVCMEAEIARQMRSHERERNSKVMRERIAYDGAEAQRRRRAVEDPAKASETQRRSEIARRAAATRKARMTAEQLSEIARRAAATRKARRVA